MKRNQWSYKTLEERFWVHVNKSGPVVCKELGPCWIWTGARVSNRYGQIRAEGKSSLAHRVAWLLETGAWPTLNVLHKCDNEQCVRFSHLFQGTQKDNVRDMLNKGRAVHNPKRGEDVATSKLTRGDVNLIRRLYASGRYYQWELAERFNVTQTNISFITLGRTWATL